MFATEWIAGLDLGQSRDHTAIALIQRHEPTTGQAEYHLRHLERPSLGTPYPAVVNLTRDLMQHPTLRGRTRLIVDATGVGRPIIDLLRQANLDPVAVTITAGDNETRVSDSEYRVPKRDLVATLQVLLQAGRLRIPATHPLTGALKKELLSFRARTTQNGFDTYEADRESTHDDLVLALALACWWSHKHGELQVWL